MDYKACAIAIMLHQVGNSLYMAIDIAGKTLALADKFKVVQYSLPIWRNVLNCVKQYCSIQIILIYP